MSRTNSQKGNSLLEFTLIGIPLVFVLISIFELSRAMWNYHTMAYAVNEAARLAVVHGKGCSDSGNSCAIKVSDVAQRIAVSGIGLVRSNLNVTLSSASGNVNCAPLSNCFTNTAVWPPASDNAAGMNIGVSAQYTFYSALAMLWPSAGSVPFGGITFSAFARQRIQF